VLSNENDAVVKAAKNKKTKLLKQSNYLQKTTYKKP
jgi:hypothetical protein